MLNSNILGESLRKLWLVIVVVGAVMVAEGFSVVGNSNRKKMTNEVIESNDIEMGALDDTKGVTYEGVLSEISELKKGLEETRKQLDERLSYQMRCNEEAMNSINTSISGASYALVIFAIIVGLGGVVLGVYITLVERKVRNLTYENKVVLETHIKIKDEVVKLDRNIKRNMAQLYNDLRKEETKALVERLVKVPEDIDNLFSNLASRELEVELFPLVKEAYREVKETPGLEFHEDQYLILCFQQFSALAMFDKDIQDEIEKRYSMVMNLSFRNDIVQASCQFLQVCMEDGLLCWKDKVKKYFIGLSISKHKEYSKLHKEIYGKLGSRENRFNLYSILSSEINLNKISKIYGQYLLDDYREGAGNSESENKVLKKIAEQEKSNE